MTVLAISGPTVTVTQVRLAAAATREKNRADEKVVELGKANGELKVALIAEEVAKKLAIEKEAVANENLDKADEVVNRFVTEISQDGGPLSKHPGTQLVRKTLLSMRREYYEQLLSSNSSKKLSPRLADANHHLAFLLQQRSGGRLNAIESNLRAIRISEALVRDNPTNLSFQASLAKSYYKPRGNLRRRWSARRSPCNV